MIRKQLDRAKNARSTPGKLRHFVQVYYEDAYHLSGATDALLPAVRAWLVYIDSPTNPALAAEAIVRQHFADAQRELLKIADLEDGELYHGSLDRLCTRWEAHGPTELADWVLQRGIKADGTLAIVPPPKPTPMSVSETAGMSIPLRQKWIKTRLAMMK
jgi:hypothetical protein